MADSKTTQARKAAEADQAKDEQATQANAKTEPREDGTVLAQDQKDFTPGDPIQQPDPIVVPTYEDGTGVQRIAGGGIRDAWEPAPTEPHPDAVAAAKLREENEKKRQEHANKLARGELTNDDVRKDKADAKDKA